MKSNKCAKSIKPIYFSINFPFWKDKFTGAQNWWFNYSLEIAIWESHVCQEEVLLWNIKLEEIREHPSSGVEALLYEGLN